MLELLKKILPANGPDPQPEEDDGDDRHDQEHQDGDRHACH